MRFVGSEGVMVAGFNTLTLTRHPREIEPGYTIGTFPKTVQEQFLKDYRAKYPMTTPSADAMRADREDVYTPPRTHNAHQQRAASLRLGPGKAGVTRWGGLLARVGL